MLGWFKKKKQAPELSTEEKLLSHPIIGSAIRARWIAKLVEKYIAEVNTGEVEYPAIQRKDASIPRLWNDTRLEAFHKMFNFGQCDLMLLADIHQQLPLLNIFMDERPHLEMPQPRGEAFADTLQGVGQLYLYLGEVGGILADPATDAAALKSCKRDILSNFSEQAEVLRAGWYSYDRSMRDPKFAVTEQPRTVFEILWEDVTAKTKSIAISKVFGPMHESGIQNMIALCSKNSSEIELHEIHALIGRLRDAREPEDCLPDETS
jgi:hypothetical protein